MTDNLEELGNDRYFITSDGVKLHYVHKGVGEPLIIIPGWGGNAYTFYYNIEELSKKFSVYILESRGHGESEDPGYGYRISRIAKDAHEFFLFLNIKKAHWMGHSMGCSVLWMYIDLFGQETINKLILIDEQPFPLANPYDTEAQIREYGGQKVDLWKIYNSFQISWEEGMESFGHENSKKYENPEVTEIILKHFKGGKSHKFLGKLLMDNYTQDWRDIIPRITVPTLYISGDVSHVTNLESSRWISKAIKNSKWVRFSEKEYGTHAMMINNAEKFNKEVLMFLNDVS